MARTIDERIVQMTFNNQEFENRAKTTISTLSNLKKATDSLSNGEWLNGVGKSIANSGLQSLTVTTQKISEGFSALEQIAIGALRNIGAQAEALATRLIKSLSVDQISEGWNKYAERTQSVQTLVNSTGKSVQEIEKYLSKLMWYSDETSFGFTDMTSALATMVSSGGNIDKLIPMIEGIGNATAYAGKGAAEFKRVIYNLNQSYSSGALTLMDWKSVENAGASSKALKEILIQTAEEVGTIKKGAIAIGDFNNSLKNKWVTSEVMEKGFTKFAEVTEAAYKLVDEGKFELASEAIEYLSGQYSTVAERAFKSAQEAKSFQEAIDATKDAVSSGWMETFAQIFGNYDEAKALWTSLTESMWEWFAASGVQRNEILKSWHEGYSQFSELIERGTIDDKSSIIDSFQTKIDELNNKGVKKLLETTLAEDKAVNALYRQLSQGKDNVIGIAKAYMANDKNLTSIIEKDSKIRLLEYDINYYTKANVDAETKRAELNRLNAELGEYILNKTQKNREETNKILESTNKRATAVQNILNALNSGSEERLLNTYKENSKYLDGILDKNGKIADIQEKLNTVSKDYSLSWRERNKQVNELNKEMLDLLKTSLELDKVEGLSKQKEAVEGLFKAIEENDPATVLKIYKENSKWLSDIIDKSGVLNKIEERRNEIAKQFAEGLIGRDEYKKAIADLDQEIMDYFTNFESGYQVFVDIINKILDNITNFKNMVSQAWNEVFNPNYLEENFLGLQSLKLIELTKKFRDFIESISLSTNQLNRFKEILKSVFSVLQLLKNIAGEVINSFIKPLGEKLQPILKDIIGIIEDLSSILFKNTQDLSNDLSPVQKILENILKILDPMIKVLGDIFKWIHDITSTMKKNAFDEEAEHISLFAKALEAAGKALDFIVSVFSGAINILSSVGNVLTQVFDKIKDVIKSFAESSGTDVSELAKGGLLGYILIGLTSVVNKLKKIDLSQVLEGIMNFFKKDSKGLIDTIKETFETLTNSIKTFTESIKIKMLEEVSNSLIKLAGALLILSLIDSGKLAVSLGALAGMLIEMIGALKLLEKIDGGNSLIKTAVVFDQIATGLIMMSIALKLISGIQPEQMVNTLGVLGVALVEVMVLMERFKKMDPKTVTESAKAFKKISEGLILLSVALKVLASINPERMASSLILLGVSLLELMGFLTITSKVINDSQGSKMIAMGKALTNMGVGLIALSVALKVMSTIDHNAMSSALLGLTVSLGALGFFMGMMGKLVGGADFVAISAGMLILSTALIALGAALAIIGSLSLETLGKGLLGVAGALLIIGGAGALFGTLSPLILLTAVAFGAFGLALITAAEGIMKFMAAYTIIQALGPQFAASLVDVFEQATAALVAAIPIFIVGVIDAVLQASEKIIELAMFLLDLLINTITEGLPRIIGLGMAIVMGILKGIRDHIGEFIIVTLEIITNLINGLAIGLPILLDALLNFIIDAINGLAESIRANAGDFGAAIGNLASAIIEGIINGLLSMLGTFTTNMFDFGIGLLDGIKNFFSGDESTQSNTESGQKVVTDIEQGIENESDTLLKQSKSLGGDTTDEYRKGTVSKKPELLTEIQTMAKDVTDKMDASEDSKISGELTLQGLYDGLTSSSWLDKISQAGAAAGRAFMSAYNSEVDINSPSKEMEESGKYTIMGLVKGLSNTRSIEETGKEIGNMVLNAIRSALDSANSILEDDLNPVITPILDLSNIQNNAGYIGELLGMNTSMNSALAINSLGSPLNRMNQNGVSDKPKELVMYNTFEINGVQNLDKTQVDNMADMLYDRINTLLGNQI